LFPARGIKLHSSHTRFVAGAFYQVASLPTSAPGAEKLKRFLIEQRWIKTTCEVIAALGWVCSTSYAIHQIAALALTGVGIFLVSTALRITIDHLKDATRVDQRQAAIIGILRSLTTAFFGEVPGYRATVLLPEKTDQYLTPVYRYQYGGPSGRTDSKAKFHKGEAFAGFAWDQPRKFFGRGDLPICKDDKEFIDFYATQFGMQPESVQQLSNRTRKIRSIICFGLIDHRHDFLGVLSLDSTDGAAFDNIPEPQFGKFVAALEATLEDGKPF
jgi:hypothetical protein